MSSVSPAAIAQAHNERLINEQVVERFEGRIKELLEEKVSVYCESSEFKTLLEEMKRKKREEMLSKIDAEVKAEHDALLALEREKAEAAAEEQRRLDAVLEENRRKLEEQRRAEMDERARQDEAKLLEIQRRQQQEEEEERQRVVSSVVVDGGRGQGGRGG